MVCGSLLRFSSSGVPLTQGGNGTGLTAVERMASEPAQAGEPQKAREG